jgi:hypothetical protein
MDTRKVVKIKGYRNPKITITDTLKVEYVQVAYDNRYVVIKQNTSGTHGEQITYDNRYVVIKQNTHGTHWEQIAKVADSSIREIFINALVNEIKDNKKQKSIKTKLVKFWNDVKEYDEKLNAEAEQDGFKK